jgi:hypothetical protein
VPEVFANRQAKANLVCSVCWTRKLRARAADRIARGEKTSFVEKPIGREVRLARDMAHGPSFEESRSGKESVVIGSLNKRNDRARTTRCERSKFKEALIVATHRQLWRKILYLIPRQPKLWKNDEISPSRCRVAIARRVKSNVGVKISKLRRDLCEGNATAPHGCFVLHCSIDHA